MDTPAFSWGNQGAPSKGGGASTLVATLGGVEVRRNGDVISWVSGLAIDADGSPRAYHPTSAWGLDRLSNAGHAGNWWGILTDNGKRNGQPVIQGQFDPAPGYYISTTALSDTTTRDYRWNDPHKFINSETIPFIVLAPELITSAAIPLHVNLGDFAVVVNLVNGKKCAAICADVGPENKLGEGSIALAKALGVNADPRTGGCAGNILYAVFAGSHTTPAWPHPLSEINARGAALVTAHHMNLPNLPA